MITFKLIDKGNKKETISSDIKELVKQYEGCFIGNDPEIKSVISYEVNNLIKEEGSNLLRYYVEDFISYNNICFIQVRVSPKSEFSYLKTVATVQVVN